MRSMIRAEFDKGRAPLFIFAGALFSFLLSLPFPVWFAPFVSALFLYPVFFYYVRRQKFFMTLISIVFWSSIHFVFTAFFYLLFPGFMEGRIESVTSAIKPGGLLVGEPFLDLIAARFVDLLFSLLLAGLSGGALALVVIVDSVNSSALWAAQTLSSFGLSAAILSIKPEGAVCGLGGAISIIAISSLFFAKLENRNLDWAQAGRLLVLGALFVALGVYLEIIMGETWQTAFEAAVNIQ